MDKTKGQETRYKHVAVIIALAAVIVTMIAFRYQFTHGDISDVKIMPIDSEIYSEEDYKEAVRVVLDYFHEHYGDCKMTEIRYAGDDKRNMMKDWGKNYGVDDVILLESDFKSGAASGFTGPLEPHSTYHDWQWVLARDKGGAWKHRDHGYA